MSVELIEDRLRRLAEWTRHWFASPPQPQPKGLSPDDAERLADLVAAVREALDFDAPVTVPGHQAAEYLRRDAAVRSRLAALDEASRG